MKKQINRKYALNQFFYFAMFASMLAFVSVYLLHKGFDNATIGTVLSLTSLSAIAIQTLLANYTDKHKDIRLQDVVSVLAAIIIAGSLALFFLSTDLLFLALVIFIFGIAQALLTFINALAFIYEKVGLQINYGMARGMGSLAYALATVFLGQVVKRTSPDILPLFYAVFALLLLFSVRSYRLPKGQPIQKTEKTKKPALEQETENQSLREFFLKYSRLVCLMVGVVFLFFAHTMINNFFIQVVTPIGGDSGSMGTAIFIGTIVELPAMMNFNQLADRIPVSRLLKISAVFFVVKHTLTFLAPNMWVVYVAQFLQIGAFSIAYPALVEYVNTVVDSKDLVKGQSLLTTAIALSGVFASFLVGVLLDTIGVSQTLLIGVVTTVIGLFIVFLSVENTAREPIDTETMNA